MRPAHLPVLVCAAAALVALTGCESTIDAARKIAAQGTKAFAAKGLSVTTVDRSIRIVSTAVVTDSNGTAAIVALRNNGRAALVNSPIAIDVFNSTGASVFRNNGSGVEFDLSHVPLLPPGQTVQWVNDQVLAAGPAKRLVARVGAGRPLRGAMPRLTTSAVHLINDPASGFVASGTVRNRSRVAQFHLVVFAVARRHGRIVAAGRAIVSRLAPGKTAPFHAYFTGNPQGAQIIISAPPSDL